MGDYTTIGFKDGSTPLNASNLNKMDEQIAANADDISTLNTDMADRFTAVADGSIFDLKQSGVYYIRNAVTDKPTSTGGFYVLSYYDDTYQVGLFMPASQSTVDTNVPYVQVSGAWCYKMSVERVSGLQLMRELD